MGESYTYSTLNVLNIGQSKICKCHLLGDGFFNNKVFECFKKFLKADDVSLFFCLTTSHLDVDCDVSTAYCQSSSGDGVNWVQYSIM